MKNPLGGPLQGSIMCLGTCATTYVHGSRQHCIWFPPFCLMCVLVINLNCVAFWHNRSTNPGCQGYVANTFNH